MILDVKGLNVDYISAKGTVRAVNDVSFQLRRGEILGVAGESGCGKSTLIMAITRLLRPPAALTGGQVWLHPRDGEPVDIAARTDRELRRIRWNKIAVVLQSAMDALNPVARLSAQFADVLKAHGYRDVERRTAELLEMVGISPDRARSYPHEMSGGMRQRAMIALALACDPELVVMDEPTTAVDVVMQRQILSQILQLRDRLGFSVVFVTHDLSLLVELAERIAVMYAGRIVEIGEAAAIYADPKHPYTKGLRDSFPPLRAPVTKLSGIPGSPPALRDLPPGCAFEPRCARRFDACAQRRPELLPVGGGLAACHLHDRERTHV
ncbi:Oligopeptide transport ATP-binding protein OppD [Nonomuraea coxensis DSM 45129]|uniref:Oligopeptide transport ATP-binding protein OppD n=1 Tax=Nonomuraea coxensis DSM 45129 TaxID=1122611 RepID=A0ABX8U798_9ACTN|nr:ABC transporter ATP-binding protein [Nonomuraea coxensis]QYC43301.1 Oligopeptide transport ATP-binding protein OppD [Nonomuraea coxensis DSM 45129]